MEAIFPSECRLTCTGLSGIIFQKAGLSIVTAVRTQIQPNKVCCKPVRLYKCSEQYHACAHNPSKLII
jgi:hypothetical protein